MHSTGDPERWQARRPPGRVVHPVPVDPTGAVGPTRAQSRSKGWRRVGRNAYVPSDVEQTSAQRAVEVAASLPPGGALTGWAALRLAGGGWFDGVSPDGVTQLPVPIVLPHSVRRTVPGAIALRSTAPIEVVRRAGVSCTDPETAVLDQMFLTWNNREKVVVMDMAAAAGLTSIGRVRARLAGDVRRRGTVALGQALDLACEASASPRETHLGLTWQLDAGFPTPLRNPDVLTLDGRFVGRPDLLDVEAGVAGEYDGAVHNLNARRRKDLARLDRFAAVGIEVFTIVAGDDLDTQVRRMRAARERARWAPEAQRAWRVVGRCECHPVVAGSQWSNSGDEMVR